jgi:hypothetical protein
MGSEGVFKFRMKSSLAQEQNGVERHQILTVLSSDPDSTEPSSVNFATLTASCI